MRLLLVNVGRNTEIRLPQGLLYLASAVGYAGHEVRIHDEALESSQDESLKKILSQEVDVIGLSVYSVPWQLKRMEDISAAIKAHRKSTIVVWGGWHPTLYPRQTMINEDVDIVVRGPGEKPLCEILDALEDRRPLLGISGLVIRENGQIVETGDACLDPCYFYPRLDFDLVDFKSYLERHDGGGGILQYITSRGCNGRCKFCVTTGLFKHRIFRKPRAQMVEELEELFSKYRITTVHFSDDNSFRNDSEAVFLSDLIVHLTGAEGIRWRCATRIDTLSNLSKDTYRRLAVSGCRGVVVGIESGSDRVLKLMNKLITVSQCREALDALFENGLRENLFFFLFGFSGERPKESLASLSFARRVRLMFPESNISLAVYFPGVSDSNWLISEMDNFSGSRLSEVFLAYYVKHIRKYRISGVRMKVLRYYFGMRRFRGGCGEGLDFLRKLHYTLVFLRIKYGIFILPFEYYFSRLRSKTGK